MAQWPNGPMADWIAAYRAAGREPAAMLAAFLDAFAGADGTTYALALMAANRQRDGRAT